MRSRPFRHAAIVGKPQAQGLRELIDELARFLHDSKLDVSLERHTAEATGLAEHGALTPAEIGKQCDVAIVVGGDGTMLAAARNLVGQRVPMTGVNQGRLGFMTDIGHDDMQAGIGAILEGRYTVEERAVLDAEIFRAERSLLRTIALNEAVVGKGGQGRLIEFELSIDGEFVYKLRGDGVIVATPTGSTAYALSAQGPILHPAVPALALVPLAPHTLSARPVSVSDRSVIEIAIVHANDARAHFDGFSLIEMAGGDRLVLRRSSHVVRFVHPPGYRYFATLREKLRWSETLEKTRGPE